MLARHVDVPRVLSCADERDHDGGRVSWLEVITASREKAPRQRRFTPLEIFEKYKLTFKKSI
jgi:hypothetical protein